ncbi:MAG: NAD(P)H-dependent oxidoreductase subunit E [Syntrophales bacterium]|nr:NAD(P)H-dependent oxidoreductase subunit E [Syntrophales bacterium]
MKQDTAILNRDNIYAEGEIDSKDILRILEKYDQNRGGLVAILEEIQSKYGYLPETALRIVSERTSRSLVDIYGVATFYRFFSLKPKGKHLSCVCLGTACHVRGAQGVVEEFEQQLGIKAGQTTEDQEFTLETVNCLGACALGPVVVIDGHYFSKVERSKVKQLLDQGRKGLDKLDIEKDERIFPIDVRCPHCNQSFKDETFIIDGYPSLKINAAMDHKQGWIRMSSLYGSYNVCTEHEIPEDMVVSFICPHCDSEIPSTSTCSECEAPMMPMPVEGGGRIKICARQGCKNRMLDLV